MDIHETPASYRVVSSNRSLHKMPFSQVVCIIWHALISVFSFLSPSEKLANSFLDGLLYFDNLKLLLMAMPAYGSPKSTKVTAFSNWSPSSTATAAISASATTTTDCRTAFTTAAADTSNPYSPPSV